MTVAEEASCGVSDADGMAAFEECGGDYCVASLVWMRAWGSLQTVWFLVDRVIGSG